MTKFIRSSIAALLIGSSVLACAATAIPPVHLVSGWIEGTHLTLVWKYNQPESLQYAWINYNKHSYRIQSAKCLNGNLALNFYPDGASTIVINPPLIDKVFVQGKGQIDLCPAK